MAYKLIIAEKPSVAAAIAKIVGATTQHRNGPTGYVEGGGYRVSWAFGHLVGLKTPEQMGFTGGELPMFPETWQTKILGRREAGKEVRDPMTDKQMKVLEELFNGASEIIVGTDAGREGELIFRYIYEYLGCRTPFRRLWISSLTDEAIRKGMADLRPGAEFDALSDAAHARSEADWLVGFNASRALRTATGYKGMLSLGRVQTPTLGMICTRYEQFKNFVPTPYWQLTADTEKGGVAFSAAGERKHSDEASAAADLARARAAGALRVDNVEKRHVTTRPPLLFDLTELQRAANSRYGMTADQTLKLTQSLYEKKYVTYPRTGSRFIPEDVFKTIPGLLAKLAALPQLGTHAAALAGVRLCRRSVDDTKVTDHHALLPTGMTPDGATDQEMKIYNLIASRTVEAFGQNAEADVTSVALSAGGVAFKASGSVTTFAGWKAVTGGDGAEEKKGKDDDEAAGTALPPLEQGDILPLKDVRSEKKTDKPKPIFTENTLLLEMKTCGKDIDDEDMREAMKDVGLGTPATRAATIEALVARRYIERDGKKLIPTALGLEIWHMVEGRKIADVQTTGEWERDLARVEHGEMKSARFTAEIKTYVEVLIEDLLKNCKPLDGVAATAEPIRTCPVCGKPMKNQKFTIGCPEEGGGCGLKIYREINGKKLPPSAIEALLTKKRTSVLKGFTSKAGKKFDAALVIEETEATDADGKTVRKGRMAYDFPKNEPTKVEGARCPCCGKDMTPDGAKLACGCGFALWTKQGGVSLTEAQIRSILAGEKVLVKNMTSHKTGKKYDALLSVDTLEKKIRYEFPERKR